MPTIELLAEIEALKAKNKELAEHVVFWVADSKEQWTRAERAEHMAALWKRDAKALRKRVAESDEAARMYCARTLKAEERADDLQEQLKIKEAEIAAQPDLFAANALLRYELAALKKDARLLAIYRHPDCPENVKAAAERILEATKEEP